MNTLIRTLLRRALPWLLAAAAAPALAAYDQNLTRTLDSGSIYGKAAAHDTQAFLGIPYAQPPVGALRWRAPQPPQPWSGSRAATTMAAMCAQVGNPFGEPDPATFGQPVGSEDCLYINVWRPRSSAENLPVLLWVHGGSNTKGSARDPSYDGAYLAQRANMVVVTVQYRLGMLGWLNHPALKTGNALDDSGNFATLDLVRALDWVRSNARAFGGNPGLVTVGGQSAGCINTWGLLQSPLAAGKFQRALCMSGIPNGYPPVVGHVAAESLIDNLLVDSGRASTLAQAAAQRLAMGPAEVAALLRGASAAQIMKYTPSPVVPGHFTDGTVIRAAGLPGLVLGDYNRMPLMIGSTHDEGSYFAFLFGMGKPTQRELWNLGNFAPPGSVSYNDLVKPEFQPIYTQTHEVISYALDNVIDNTIRLLRLTNADLYRYNFNWDDSPQPWKDTFGAFHGIDVAALFGNFVTEEPNFMRFAWSPANADSRKALSDRFIDYFASFARHGTPSRLFDGRPTWNNWTNFVCLLCNKRMVFDNRSAMSPDDYLFFWPRYALLSPQQRELLWRTIDFNSLPESVDPLRGGTR